MSILATKAIETIEESDLAALIEIPVAESLILEFKREAIGGSDADKKEFLKDVTAFANTAGGDLVIGMAAKDGVADKLFGIPTPAADKEILRLEDILRNGIEPRLVGVHIHPVTLSEGGYALVIRVPKSRTPPHRAAFKGSNRYFVRNTAGAYELSVEQLRSVFLGGAELERRLTEFRVERLARLAAGDEGIRVAGDGQLILHICPINPQPTPPNLPMTSQPGPNPFAPITLSSQGSARRPNFDGLILFPEYDDDRPVPAYTQLFRDGRLEAVSSRIFYGGPNNTDKRVIYMEETSEIIFKFTRQYVGGLRECGVEFPFAVMISLVGVKGSRRAMTEPRFESADPVDRDRLLFPTIILETTEFADRWQTQLRPVIEALWNAYGEPRSPYFDENGNWRDSQS